MGRSMFVMMTYIMGSLLGSPKDALPMATKKEKNNGKLPPVHRTQAALEDQVHSLPGLQYEPKFDMFAGYLDPVASRHVL
jgi:hypothetical protein